MTITTPEIVMGGVSVLLLAGTFVVVPRIIRGWPPDYFVRPQPKHSRAVTILRNVIGFALLALGIAMMILPGPGIVTVVIGLTIIDLPIKHRILEWLLHRAKIQETIQRVRSKAGKQPLVIPHDAAPAR